LAGDVGSVGFGPARYGDYQSVGTAIDFPENSGLERPEDSEAKERKTDASIVEFDVDMPRSSDGIEASLRVLLRSQFGSAMAVAHRSRPNVPVLPRGA
jgi:hypothetical protein